jgi:hypothetical protein
MAHKLRIPVRLDTGASASLLVTGCLTDDSCPALLPVMGRTLSLISGRPVTASSGDHRMPGDVGIMTSGPLPIHRNVAA